MICLKFTTFVVAATVGVNGRQKRIGCDLLKIYYLCGSSNSRQNCGAKRITVVICLKFTTFVVAATVSERSLLTSTCCDLLKIYYLCGSSNSAKLILTEALSVVICLKFTTFVVAATVARNICSFIS